MLRLSCQCYLLLIRKGCENLIHFKNKKLIIIGLFIIIFSFILPTLISNSSHASTSTDKLVYVIPIEKEVERGLEAFLIRSTNEAIDAGANHIIFEIDTPGGRVDSAGQIAKLLQDLEIESTSYIINEALSAGSYIALNTDNIYMKKQATMGASGVITSDGNAADKKAQSAWIAAMRSAAESNNRDPIYAEAMANEKIDLPEFGAPKGEYLTLGPKDAVKVGYAEGVVNNRIELLSKLDLVDATLVETETAFAEEVARFVTSPVVIPILLSIASLGLVVELYSPGFGVAGTMGLTALILFFYGHIIAGLAGMESVVLLILGIIFIVIEFFIVSGFIGILGGLSILVSLLLAGYDFGQMAISIAISFVVAIIAAIYLFKSIAKERGLFNKLVLKDRSSTSLGYTSTNNREDLIGEKGKTLTPLRPSGIVMINNERLDVVSQGDFVDSDKEIEVIIVEGSRIVVQEIKK